MTLNTGQERKQKADLTDGNDYILPAHYDYKCSKPQNNSQTSGATFLKLVRKEVMCMAKCDN